MESLARSSAANCCSAGPAADHDSLRDSVTLVLTIKSCAIVFLLFLVSPVRSMFARFELNSKRKIALAQTCRVKRRRRLSAGSNGECLASGFKLRRTCSKPSFRAHKYRYVFTFMPHWLLLLRTSAPGVRHMLARLGGEFPRARRAM